VGTQSFRVSGAFAADYRNALDPSIIGERVWIERKGESLILHIGRLSIVDGGQAPEDLSNPARPPAK
jgi:hypothetical protein